jgi:hypothetical protein
MATLAAPGGFSIIAPADTEGVLIWAVLDSDGDGAWDLSTAPFDSHGPVNTGTGLSGIVLDLGAAPPGTVDGQIDWSGIAGPTDVLHVGVFTAPVWDPSQGPPVVSIVESGVTFPYTFSFDGLVPGTYWAGAYLDIGGNNPDGAGPEDPGGQEGPILLAPGGSQTTTVDLFGGR